MITKQKLALKIMECFVECYEEVDKKFPTSGEEFQTMISNAVSHAYDIKPTENVSVDVDLLKEQTLAYAAKTDYKLPDEK